MINENIKEKIIYATAKVYNRSYTKVNGETVETVQKTIPLKKDIEINNGDAVIVIKNDTNIDNVINGINNDDKIEKQKELINDLQIKISTATKKEKSDNDKIINLQDEISKKKQEIIDLEKQLHEETKILHHDKDKLAIDLNDSRNLNNMLYLQLNNAYTSNSKIGNDVKKEISNANVFDLVFRKSKIKSNIDTIVEDNKIEIKDVKSIIGNSTNHD